MISYSHLINVSCVLRYIFYERHWRVTESDMGVISDADMKETKALPKFVMKISYTVAWKSINLPSRLGPQCCLYGLTSEQFIIYRNNVEVNHHISVIQGWVIRIICSKLQW